MSLLPEIVLQSILASSFKEARRDDETLDMLFRNTRASIVQELKDSFKDVTVDITLNYPREDISLPCIAILLRGEDESEPVLGDLLGSGYGPGTINGLAQAGTAARGSADSRIREEFFYTPETGAVVLPAEAAPTQTIIGEPRPLFVDDGMTLYQRSGVGYNASYMVHILARNPEMVIFLYTLVKFFFQRHRMVLERNGIRDFVMSGTDFAPQTAFLPDYVYSRALSCRFLYFFDYVLTEGKEGSLGFGEGSANQTATGFDITIDSLDHNDSSVDVAVSALDQLPVVQSCTPSSIPQGVSAELIIEGINLHNVASIRFPSLEYDAAGPTGIEIASTEYIDGNKLRATVYPHSTGTSTVVVINPDSLSTTLQSGITVTA